MPAIYVMTDEGEGRRSDRNSDRIYPVHSEGRQSLGTRNYVKASVHGRDEIGPRCLGFFTGSKAAVPTTDSLSIGATTMVEHN